MRRRKTPSAYFLLTTLKLLKVNETYEAYDKACSSWRTLMYREDFELNAKDRTGAAVYKISLYDLLINRCTCVKIIMDTESHSSAIFSVKEQIDLNEGEALTSSEEMFENLYKIYPIRELYTREPPVKPMKPWQPGPHMKPVFIQEYFGIKEVPNYNLYVRFEIKDKATMKIEIYGEPHEIKINLTTTTAKTTTVTTATEKTTAIAEEEKVELKNKRKETLAKALNKRIKKPGRAKGVPDSRSRLRFNKPHESKTITTTKAYKFQRFLNPDFSGANSTKINRDSSKLYNITRLWPKKGARKKIIPSPLNRTYLHQTRRGRGRHSKVRFATQIFTTDIPYPTALVESVNSVAGSTKGVVIQITLIKIICFDVLMSLLHF